MSIEGEYDSKPGLSLTSRLLERHDEHYPPCILQGELTPALVPRMPVTTEDE